MRKALNSLGSGVIYHLKKLDNLRSIYIEMSTDCQKINYNIFYI